MFIGETIHIEKSFCNGGGGILAPPCVRIHYCDTGKSENGKGFVRIQMNCSSHIEFAYYGSDVGRKDISVHCASTNCSSKDPELHVLKNYKFVLPVCQQCIDVRKIPQNES